MKLVFDSCEAEKKTFVSKDGETIEYYDVTAKVNGVTVKLKVAPQSKSLVDYLINIGV